MRIDIYSAGAQSRLLSNLVNLVALGSA